MSEGQAYASERPEHTESGGACSSCGRPLPPPDLEAVAASIDQTLSLETGKMVPRTAWAGRAPDGVMDALLFFMPSVKAGRQLWERGQTLWTEQMTQALSGPCDDCQKGLASASGGVPAQTTVQPYDDVTAVPAATAYMPYEPADRSSPADVQPSTVSLSADDGGEPMTSAIPAFVDRAAPSSSSAPPTAPPEDAHTTAFPSFSTPPTPPPPAPARDEHESHTIMISALPSLRVTTRLVAIEGPVRGRQFSLGRERTTIGRSIGCHVTIEADAVEYDHARIVRSGDSWQIEVAETASALWVNDEPIQNARQLKPGDIIRIGPARLRFESAS